MKQLIRLIRVIKSNIIFCISVTGALIFHLVLAWQSLNNLEGLSYFDGPLTDDSYIFFSISRDLVDWFSGCLPSFQLTSGIQPLIALLYTPFFHFFWDQMELPIHLALSLNAFLGFFANIFLYYLLRKIVNRSIATFLVSVWIWSPYVMNQTINGMETTLALLLLLITLNYYWRIVQASSYKRSYWIFLGLLIGIGFWARVDLVMVGVAIVLDQALLAIKGDQHSRLLRLRNITLCSLTALAIASPWIVFTFISTGNLMPISGRAVHQMTSINFNYFYPNHPGFLYMMFVHVKRIFLICQPLVALFKHISWQLFISSLSLLGFILAVRDRQLCTLYRPIWIFQAIILASYIIFIGGWWYVHRYLYSVFTLMLFLHAATLRYLESRFKLKSWVLVIIFFFLFIPYTLSYTFQYHSLWSKNCPSRYLSGALFAKAHIPPKAKVGAFQSGCLSYWLDNQIINLDGVINEEAYLHLKNKTMDIYLEERQIDYLVDEVFLFRMWDSYLGRKLSKQYMRIALKKNKCEPRRRGNWGVYKRKSGKD